MKRFLKTLVLIAARVAVATTSLLIPRDRRLWLIGSWQGHRFADNGKWFYLYCAKQPGIRAVFSTKNPAVYDMLRRRGLPVVKSQSMKGIWTALRAGAYVYDASPHDAMFWAIRGAFWVQMWHGVPLKRLERDIEDSEHPTVRAYKKLDRRNPIYIAKTLMRDPWLLRKYDLACCTSATVLPILARAFGIPESRMKITGYPRNDAMFMSSALLDASEPDPWGKDLTGDIHSALSTGRRIILYMPTYREQTSARDSISASFVFENTWSNDEQLKIDETLNRYNATLFVKLHPHVKANWKLSQSVTNLFFLPSELDVYSVLNKVDLLITDYSSIFFDYLLLEKPIIFYSYDLDHYRGSRGLYFDYESVTPGLKVRTIEELIAAIRLNLCRESHNREDLRSVKETFHRFHDGSSSQRLVAEIMRELSIAGTV
jgi:CDP-glycerol glycerophosphotransferase (TagB/SpsB family)